MVSNFWYHSGHLSEDILVTQKPYCLKSCALITWSWMSLIIIINSIIITLLLFYGSKLNFLLTCSYKIVNSRFYLLMTNIVHMLKASVTNYWSIWMMIYCTSCIILLVTDIKNNYYNHFRMITDRILRLEHFSLYVIWWQWLSFLY